LGKTFWKGKRKGIPKNTTPGSRQKRREEDEKKEGGGILPKKVVLKMSRGKGPSLRKQKSSNSRNWASTQNDDKKHGKDSQTNKKLSIM